MAPNKNRKAFEKGEEGVVENICGRVGKVELEKQEWRNEILRKKLAEINEEMILDEAKGTLEPTLQPTWLKLKLALGSRESFFGRRRGCARLLPVGSSS